MKSTFILILIVVALANANKKHEAVMGIDIGTTYSCSVVYRDGRVGVSVIPSYIAFSNGEILTGTAAKNQAAINPENTVFGVKRLIGRDWRDRGLEEDIKAFPFKIFQKNNKPFISVNTGKDDKDISSEEITAMIMKQLKDTAEEYIGPNVSAVVITVPVYFNDAQREATKEAGKIAGLNVLSVTNEATAAAVAYGFGKTKGDMNILVYHFGGGTFYVTILTVHHGVIQTVATHGDPHLGGQDLNQRIIGYFIEQYKEKGINIMSSQHAIQKLGEEIEKAKQTLSSEQQVKIDIKSFYQGEDFLETLTREKFEELNMGLFTSTMVLVEKVLKDAQMTVENIDKIILTGGSTQIPIIRQLLTKYFNRSLYTHFKPSEAVAYGAAVQAHTFINEDEMEWNANPLSIGINTFEGVMFKVIPSLTFLPTKKTLVISTSIDNQEIVTFGIYQGEQYLAKDNRFLGEIELKGILAAARGEPQIEVTLELDVNSVLHVTAEDKGSGVTENIDIATENAPTRLRLSEIDELLEEERKFHDIDKYDKEKVEARAKYENYLFSVEKQIKELNMNDYLIVIKQILEIHKIWLEDSYLDASTQDYKTQLRALESLYQPIIKKYQEEYKDEL